MFASLIKSKESLKNNSFQGFFGKYNLEDYENNIPQNERTFNHFDYAFKTIFYDNVSNDFVTKKMYPLGFEPTTGRL
jgi:hypothetical protein